MRAGGVRPNVVTYNTLVDVFGKTGQWERAVRVLDDMGQDVSRGARRARMCMTRGMCVHGTRRVCIAACAWHAARAHGLRRLAMAAAAATSPLALTRTP